MARWSPSRTVQTTPPTVFDALNELIDRGHQSVQGRREREELDRQRDIEDEQLGREEERHELATAMEELEFYRAGGRRFEGGVPTREAEPGESVFEGQRPGMASERTEEAPPIFRGERPGMAAGAGREGVGAAARDPSEPLAQGLDGLLAEGRPRGASVVAPAGSFVPGLGFAPKNITDQELFAGERPGERPTLRRETDRYRHLRGDRYLDTQAGQEEGDDLESRTQLADRLIDMGATREEAMLVMTDPSRVDDIIDRIEGREEREEEQFTEDELRAAGVPEGQIRAAMRDPALARSLMTGRDGDGDVTPNEAQRIAREERDAFISRLIADGERDPRQILERADEAFPNVSTSLQDVEAQLGAGDPQVEDRRDAILSIAHPVQYGGGDLLYQVVDDLAQGRSREEIEQEVLEAVDGETDHPAYRRVSNYLGVVGAAEGLSDILNPDGE